MDDAKRIELLNIALFCAQELNAVMRELYPGNPRVDLLDDLADAIRSCLTSLGIDPNDTGIESKIHPTPAADPHLEEKPK